jgi:hypothetical protein
MRNAFDDKSRLAPIFLSFLGVAALIAGIGMWQSRQETIPASLEIGEIVNFGAIQGRTANRLLVTVRTSDRGTASLTIPAELLFYCHVRGPIRLSRQGQLLRVRSPGCAPPI